MISPSLPFKLHLEETSFRGNSLTFQGESVCLFSKKPDRNLDVKCDFLEFVLIDCQMVTAELEDVTTLSYLPSKYLHINLFL